MFWFKVQLLMFLFWAVLSLLLGFLFKLIDGSGSFSNCLAWGSFISFIPALGISFGAPIEEHEERWFIFKLIK